MEIKNIQKISQTCSVPLQSDLVIDLLREQENSEQVHRFSRRSFVGQGFVTKNNENEPKVEKNSGTKSVVSGSDERGLRGVKTTGFLRFYYSNIGRWISRDPANELGGECLYIFCNNNAICLTDLLGQLPDDIWVHINEHKLPDPPKDWKGEGLTSSNENEWVKTLTVDTKCSALNDCVEFKIAEKSLTINVWYADEVSQYLEDDHIADLITWFSGWIADIQKLGKCDCPRKVQLRRELANNNVLKDIYYYSAVVDALKTDTNQYPDKQHPTRNHNHDPIIDKSWNDHIREIAVYEKKVNFAKSLVYSSMRMIDNTPCK